MVKKPLKQVEILKVDVSSTSTTKVLSRVRQNLLSKAEFLIVTPNPEIILQAQKDNKLKSIINKSDLSLPDGIGVVMANRFNMLSNPSSKLVRLFALPIQGIIVGASLFLARKWLFGDLTLIHGRKMFLDLVGFASRNNLKVYLFGSEGNVSERAKEKLEFKHRNLKVEASTAPCLNEQGKPVSKQDKDLEKIAIAKINRFAPDILFIGISPPKQEKWFDKNKSKLKVGGAMVVGGSFDYVAGEVKLPPKWVEKLEMEWGWRMVTQPKRFKRVLNAFVVFPWKVFLDKLRNIL